MRLDTRHLRIVARDLRVSHSGFITRAGYDVAEHLEAAADAIDHERGKNVILIDELGKANIGAGRNGYHGGANVNANGNANGNGHCADPLPVPLVADAATASEDDDDPGQQQG